MKYVLTQQTKDFIKAVCADEARAESIIAKAEAVFNAEQSNCHFDIGEMEHGMSRNFATIFLCRFASCEDVKEDWELTADEIDSLDQEKKLAA